jgi:hypothetical protein
MSEDVHEVYAIRYAHHARHSRENFIGGDPHDVLQPLDYFVWAIVGAAGTIVVDTGFDETIGARRQREITRPVREGLAAIGIVAERCLSSSSAICTSIIAGTTICFRVPAITCRIAKWPTRPAAQCATRLCESRSRPMI